MGLLATRIGDDRGCYNLSIARHLSLNHRQNLHSKDSTASCHVAGLLASVAVDAGGDRTGMLRIGYRSSVCMDAPRPRYQ